MARPSKELLEHVNDGTFRARRHHSLLGAGELLPWKSLSRLQEAYRLATHELDARRVAVEFEREIPRLQERRARSRKTLPEILNGLGPAGSVERVAGIANRFCRLENGQRMRLREYQLDVLRRFLRRDKKGRRVFKVLLFGIARGNGKTPFADVLGLDAVLDHDRYESKNVFQVAGSKEQAAIGREFLSGWVHDGELNEWVKVKSRLDCESSGGSFRILSSDGRLAHGRKFRRGIGDELWLFTNYRETQSWVALESALHKDPECDLIGISTAGYDLTSMLGEKYSQALELDHVEISKDGCVTIAEDTDNGFLMYWIGAPEDADIENPAIMRACNPLLNEAQLRQMMQELHRPGADELEYRRLHGNQWTKVKNAWLPTGAWRAILTDDVMVPVGAEIYVGVDAAYSGDTTAVVFAWRGPDGRIHLRSRIFSTSRKNPAHVYVDEPTLDNEQLVESYIYELARIYKIREIVFDPEYFTNEAKHLARAGFTIAPLYPQSGDMSDAIRATRRMVLEKKLAADRADKPLTAHFEAAEGRKVIRGTKEFDAIQKPNRDVRIDGATAGTTAAWRCLVDEGARPFVMVAGTAKPKPIPAESPKRHATADAPWNKKPRRRR